MTRGALNAKAPLRTRTWNALNAKTPSTNGGVKGFQRQTAKKGPKRGSKRVPKGPQGPQCVFLSQIRLFGSGRVLKGPGMDQFSAHFGQSFSPVGAF